MNLSPNLSLAEAVKSQTAIRHGIDNNPDDTVLENLRRVANKIFQPVRDHFGKPIAVTSGYRCEELNTRIGGSRSSSHCKGEALDLDADVYGGLTNRDIFDYIKGNLKFDQLIYEFGTDEQPAWVHVSLRAENNRQEILRASRVDGRTSYSHI